MTKFRDRLNWDTAQGQILDADRRYVMLRADVLMGLFRRLDEPARTQALDALGQAVREQGGLSAKAYWEAIHHDPQALLDSIAHISAQLGWGNWDIQTQRTGGLQVRVTNSPFAKGFGAHDRPLCRPIVGMLTAVGQLIYDQHVQVQEKHCCAQGRHVDCLFTVLPKSNE
jgi:predicted hydrocarbon binding protein